MHCCIPTPTADSNTSMMSNTYHAECRRGVPRTVREFHIVWRVVTLNYTCPLLAMLELY